MTQSWQLFRRWCLAAAFHDGEHAIYFDIANDVDPAADPTHTNLFDRAPLAQAEVEPLPKITLVAAPTMNLVDLGQFTSRDRYASTDAVAIGCRAAQLDLKPVVCAG